MWNGNLLGYYVGYKVYEVPNPYKYKTVKINTNKEDKEEELVIDNLKKHTKYSVVVQAYNRIGKGPFSDEIIINTYEDGKCWTNYCTAINDFRISSEDFFLKCD